MPLRALLLSLVLLALTASPALAGGKHGGRYVQGAAGSGDPYFPLAGNGGYDVKHYAVELEYVAETRGFEGDTDVYARATQNLRSFNLDLRDWMTVESVRVDGRRADFSQHSGQELTVVPRRKLDRGERFKVSVKYGGTQQEVIDPDGSSEGWIPTNDGAFVVNEPQGSPGWYPVNDSPKDKATFYLEATVPAGRTVMGNGKLLSSRTRGGETEWRWLETDPMAPYLATATNGVFETRAYRTDSGLPMFDAVDPQTRGAGQTTPDPATAWSRLALQGEIVDFFVDLYGRYPFESGGGIVDWAPNVFYSLESQSRANYWRTPPVSTVVHEIAHQWFGNAVTLEVWPDIWLNEGFATWSEWIYTERHGGQSAQQRFDSTYALPPEHSFWTIPPGDVGGPENLFAGQVYTRGAMTLQALRVKAGDDSRFFRLLRRWYRENRYDNASTRDFIRLSERTLRMDLDGFFQDWLYEPSKPPAP